MKKIESKLDVKKISAFTLIELLVVISIIGILAALALVSFTGAQKQARDAQRKSDLRQYQTALESYANKNNTYIIKTSAYNPVDLCAALTGSSSCPTDPKSEQTYFYCTNESGTQFVLWARTENVTGYWIVCYSGKSGMSSSTLPTCGGYSINCQI